MRGVPITLALVLGAPLAPAQEPVRVRVCDVREVLIAWEGGDVEARALAARRLATWLTERAQETGAAIGELLDRPGYRPGPAGLVLLAGADELRGAEIEPSLAALLAALRAPPQAAALEEVSGYLSFAEALERVPDHGATLDALEREAPGHPWLSALRRLLDHGPAIERVATALDRLGQPDVRRVRRGWFVHLDGPGETQGIDPCQRIVTVSGWVLGDGERGPELFTDLQQRQAYPPAHPVPPDVAAVAGGPLPRFEPRDPLEECRRWLLAPLDAREHSGCLGCRAGPQILAAWAWRLGRPFLAGRLMGLVVWGDRADCDPREEAAAWALTDLLGRRTEHAQQRLAGGAPRSEARQLLSPVVELLAREPAARGLTPRTTGALESLLQRVRTLDGHLQRQEALDRARGPAPGWEAWRAMLPQDRVAWLVDLLRDQRETPRPSLDGLEWSGAPTFPPDAPPGAARSPGEWLLEAGEPALGALIEVLGDAGPTRALCGGELLPVSALARKTLERMWCLPLQPLAGRGLQEEARQRVAAWKGRGGLGGWHAARLVESGDELEQVDHACALLRYDRERARPLIAGVLARVEPGSQERRRLLRAIGAVADPAHTVLLAGAAGSERAELAWDAALGLVALGDPRGGARCQELLRQEPGSIGIEQLRGLARAGAADLAGRLYLEQVERSPWFHWHLGMLTWGLPDPDLRLGLARIAAQRRDQEGLEYVRENLRWLARQPAGTLADELLGALLAIPSAELAHAPRRAHAAATVLGLGLEAVARWEAEGRPAVRPELLAALGADDPLRSDAFAEALGRLGDQGLEWAQVGLAPDAPQRATLERLRQRAALRVRRVELAHRPAPDPLASSLLEWADAAWDPARTAVFVELATGSESPIELVIERAADLRGVTVRLGQPPPEHESGLGVLVAAPGLEREGPLAPDQLGPLLNELGRALARDPAAPAGLRLRWAP